MNAFEKLKTLVSAAEKDAESFYTKGNKSAGTRLRKALQQVKSLAHEGRTEVSKVKNQQR